jgi:imidazolonepropionase-like amidohydrolase
MKYKFTLILLSLIQYLNIYSQPLSIEDFPALPDSFFKEHLKSKSNFYILENVNIIPMNKDTIFKNQSVLIKDGKILRIVESKKIQPPSNAEIIDGTGKYLIPGLTDMHVHFFNQNDLILFVANGVTTVRNMMGNQTHLNIRDKIKKNTIFGPGIFTTGPYIYQLNDINQAKTIVPECKKSGYDYLKIFGSITDECYSEIMKQSRIYGIKAVGHLPYFDGLKAAIEERQYTIEHILILISKEGGFFDSIDTKENINEKLRMLAQSGTWLCPTITPALYDKSYKNKEYILKNSQFRYIHPAEFMKWYGNPFKDDNYDDLVNQSIKKFLDMKGKILLGTDCGIGFIMPGFTVHDELRNFVNAGLTPYQALKAGTYNAADCLGTLDNSGTIEINKIADFVLLNGNPLENINNTRNIEGVMLKGVWFSKNELQEMLDYLTNYYRHDIIPQYTKRANLPEEVKKIYFGDYKFDGKSNIKSRIIFGITVLILLSSTIFAIWKIKHPNNKSKINNEL